MLKKIMAATSLAALFSMIFASPAAAYTYRTYYYYTYDDINNNNTIDIGDYCMSDRLHIGEWIGSFYLYHSKNNLNPVGYYITTNGQKNACIASSTSSDSLKVGVQHHLTDWNGHSVYFTPTSGSTPVYQGLKSSMDM
jgi:hypothetical protein